MVEIKLHDPNVAESIVLTDSEINAFFDDIDTNCDGTVTLKELEARLEQIYFELAPEQHSHHDNRQHHDPSDVEHGSLEPTRNGVALIEHSLLPDKQECSDRNTFIKHVRTWNIPSQMQGATGGHDKAAAYEDAERRLSFHRRMQARWSVEGAQVVCLLSVALLTIGLSLWQGVMYDRSPIGATLGWGVTVAKFSAGALYSVMFFLLLSMSRIFARFVRRFFYFSRFINWDRSQIFHIWLGYIALALVTLHAIGHLSGTFPTGSRPERQSALAELLNSPPMSYAEFVATLPGWTGVTCLALFWIIAILSLPAVRRWSYEVFQLGHLLMFPLIALLSAHGVTRLLGQYPMLGFWLLLPGTLVITERGLRFWKGFIGVPTQLKILDDETITLSYKHPRGRFWRYSAGQYVLLQVPSLSTFQWHPFTISASSGDSLQLHIKLNGNWTRRLRDLPAGEVRVGIDGPYGAPAQKFYDFDRSIIIGSGVGVTPFSAIMTDLEHNLSHGWDPWAKARHINAPTELVDGSTLSPCGQKPSPRTSLTVARRPTRRVDFHWMVRDRNHLLWFSSLLNRACHLREHDKAVAALDLRINTYITAQQKDISTHVFRHLLGSLSTATSAKSGMRSQCGRPDLLQILRDFHDDMLREGLRNTKVGVFFCGAKVIGRVLADACMEVTMRSWNDGSRIRYIFMMEVFG